MTAPLRLDVRSLPTWQRHPMIFSAFDGLREGQALVLISDHEPRPLHVQFEELRRGRYGWNARNLGNDRWEVELRRLSDASTADDFGEAVLRRAAAFASGSARTRAALASAALVRRYTRGDAVFRQGVRWPFLGIVCEGAVAMIVTGHGGRQRLLFEAVALEMFGEASALDGGSTLGDATVISGQLASRSYRRRICSTRWASTPCSPARSRSWARSARACSQSV